MTRTSLFVQDARTTTRNATEKRFRAYGLTAIVLALLALVWLGWPLHGIASDLRALRKMAEKGR